MEKIAFAATKSLIFCIHIYQYSFTALFGNCCRFTPSCSSFSIQALHSHGVLKGSFLSIKRIFSCHPWHKGGIDLVPENKNDH
jgi:putative membrane protein insertion efficiency factor